MIASVRQLLPQKQSRFPLGALAVTRGVQYHVKAADVAKMVARHLEGDWGDVCDEDKSVNDQAVENGGGILSSYRDSQDRKVWIKTDGYYGPDHPSNDVVTTVLLPDEY